MTFTELKLNQIQEEVNLYYRYNDLTDEEKLSLDNLIKNKLPNLETIKNKRIKVILYYFISHIDDYGNLISLEKAIKIYTFVRKKYSFYKRIRKYFLKEVFINNKPIFFIDVDHTLTDNNVISEEKIEFIKNFKYNNRIILSTGKIKDAIEENLKLLNIDDNYHSTLNGSVVWKNSTPTFLRKLDKISKQIKEKLDETNLEYILYYENELVDVKPLDQACKDGLIKYNETKFIYPKKIDYSRIVKILIFIKEKDFENEKIVDNIISDYPELKSIRSGEYTYEILLNDQHKGISLKYISALLKTYYKATIAIGDSMNDFKMLEYSGLPHIVSTASDDLKKYNYKIISKNRNKDISILIDKYWRKYGKDN